MEDIEVTQPAAEQAPPTTEQTSQTSQPAEATETAAAEATAAAETLAAPTLPIGASFDFVAEMGELAGITDIKQLRKIQSMGLTEAGVRRHLIGLRSDAQASASAAVTSTILPNAASASATSTPSNPMDGLQAQARQLNLSDPSLSVEQHFSRLMKSNPKLYNQYLQANPAQRLGVA